MTSPSPSLPDEPKRLRLIRDAAPALVPLSRAAASVAELTNVFQRHLYLPDLLPLHALLGAVAANVLPGDPIWLGLIAPPSSAKTEMLNSLSLLKHPRIWSMAAITPAGLLSGTSRKDRAAHAKGGLLKEVGDFGIISCKDFGSALSQRQEVRAETMAALREIYDGAWTRHVGSDFGQTLEWRGKLGFIFGCTPVIDSQHSVTSAMGERFLFARIPDAGAEQAERALSHGGVNSSSMRRELGEIVAQLFEGRRAQPAELTPEESSELVSLASVAVRLRSPVERNRSREIECIPGAEGPARLVKMLLGLLNGLDVLGYPRALALEVVRRVAHDSVPPQRRRAFDFLRQRGAPTETEAVAAALKLSTNVARRILQDLNAYDLVTRNALGDGKKDFWSAGATP